MPLGAISNPISNLTTAPTHEPSPGLPSLPPGVAGLQVSHFPRHNNAEWYTAMDTLERLPAAAVLPRGGVGDTRLFAGERGRMAAIELRDMPGRARLRLYVDSLGSARLEFSDERGSVVRRLPSP